mmetsp:Transcript_51799/g.155447  ORF Transcript_51799/g.155447 Transcript_51799/m.155447 type:complete len:244 (+) Transcript_51799:1134-1865(+)
MGELLVRHLNARFHLTIGTSVGRLEPFDAGSACKVSGGGIPHILGAFVAAASWTSRCGAGRLGWDCVALAGVAFGSAHARELSAAHFEAGVMFRKFSPPRRHGIIDAVSAFVVAAVPVEDLVRARVRAAAIERIVREVRAWRGSGWIGWHQIATARIALRAANVRELVITDSNTGVGFRQLSAPAAHGIIDPIAAFEVASISVENVVRAGVGASAIEVVIHRLQTSTNAAALLVIHAGGSELR